jgi:hypothetical protein
MRAFASGVREAAIAAEIPGLELAEKIVGF